MGVCNGFQILCEARLLPGALLHNNNQKFVCKNVYIKPKTNNSLVTASLEKDKPLNIPVAHAEGRFFAPEDMLKDILEYDGVLFKYCNEKGVETPESNPNGALMHIAGICNKTRNVFGMMPHPERASDTELNNTDGKLIFDSILKNFK